MKAFYSLILTIIGNLWLYAFSRNAQLKHCWVERLKLRISYGNLLVANRSKFKDSRITLSGSNNEVHLNQDSHCIGTKIEVNGMGNNLTLEEGAQLRNSWVQIRGRGNRIFIGRNTTTGGLRIVNCGSENTVSIGSDCLIADEVEIWSSDTHSIFDENDELINRDKPVTIGDRVWLGSNVKIMKGVAIGSGAVVGHSSLVTRNIPENSLCAGAPAKVLKANIRWSIEAPWDLIQQK